MKKLFLVRVSLTLLILANFAGISFGQDIDWDNYKAIKAAGKIPEIFSTTTQEKIEADLQKGRASMSTADELLFLEHIHYNLDELLGSGLVLFGDPSTDYVRKVANNLLSGNNQLKKELQFFVLKSNLTNALSTDQGVIFVTLGLLAQIENEAQLAYVLSHEIAHFQEKHVEKSYNNSQDLRHESSYDARIRSLSNHSKESELEADKLGIKLYHEAGYKKSELLSAFDVLMYSYLPFDEVELPKTYFNSEELFVPEMYFPEKVNPILAEEDYDDEKSTHPNIQKRKTAIREHIKSYENWGNKDFIFEKAEFEKVRKLARYEGVHRDLIDCNYADVLYGIFLLEREEPNSRFLDRSKAKAWLGLATFKENGSFSDAVSSPSDVEGESHAMHFMLRKFTKLQLFTVAMRQIEDLSKRHPSDAEIKKIRNKMIALLSTNSSFKLEKYRRITYESALERFERSKETNQDSIALETDSVDVQIDTNVVLSKYDKIKMKRETEEVFDVTDDEEFDVESFYLYALGDLAGDEDFTQLLKQFKDEADEKEREENERNNLSRQERKTLEKKEQYLGLSEVIMMKPLVVQWYYDEIQIKESAELEVLVREAVLSNAEKKGISVHDLANSQLNALTTEQYNRQATLVDFLRQKSAYEGEDMFPVDYEDLKEIDNSYNNSKLMFVLTNFKKTAATRSVNLVFLIMDIENGEVEKEYSYYFRSSPKKNVLNMYVYDALNSMGVAKSQK